MEVLDKSKSGNPMEGEARGKMSIEEFLAKDEQKDLLRFLTAGSVDDGKSTLIGRLLFDSKKLYEDQLDALERDSKRMGNAGEHIDYALLLDGLKAEREQGITIDVAYRYFSTNNRKFIIADTPGHEQYTRNMITGGSTANLAVILVDARTFIHIPMPLIQSSQLSRQFCIPNSLCNPLKKFCSHPAFIQQEKTGFHGITQFFHRVYM